MLQEKKIVDDTKLAHEEPLPTDNFCETRNDINQDEWTKLYESYERELDLLIAENERLGRVISARIAEIRALLEKDN